MTLFFFAITCRKYQQKPFLAQVHHHLIPFLESQLLAMFVGKLLVMCILACSIFSFTSACIAWTSSVVLAVALLTPGYLVNWERVFVEHIRISSSVGSVFVGTRTQDRNLRKGPCPNKSIIALTPWGCSTAWKKAFVCVLVGTGMGYDLDSGSGKNPKNPQLINIASKWNAMSNDLNRNWSKFVYTTTSNE